MPDSRATTPAPWIATEATVVACRYQSSALSSMAFGVGLDEKFLITFDYYAHGTLYSGQFGSPTAIAQNEKIALSYNPLDPHENSITHAPTAARGARSPLIGFGIAGSVVFSLAWLLVLRSCNPH